MDSGKRYNKKKVAIIGGGVGGLTLAARLAKNKQLDITIYEKNDKVGGRCWTFDSEGYKFEQGAILYLFDEVYKYVFEQIGEKFIPEKDFAIDDSYHRIFLKDEKIFNYTKVNDAFVKEIEQLEPCSDAKRKLDFFCEKCERLEKFTVEKVFKKTYDTVWEMVSFLVSNFITNLEIMWTSIRYTMHSIVDHYFKTNLVCEVLSFQSLYFGLSPYTGSALFSTLVAYDIASGLKYPIGGMGRIVKLLEEIAIRKNVKIETGKGVRRIVIEGKKATGIILEDDPNKEIPYDIIVSNADLTYTYNVLLKQKDAIVPKIEKRAAELAKKNHLPSTFTFFWGMNQKIDKLRAQNTFLPDDYEKLFHDIHVLKKIPDDPAFFIHIANRMDPGMAPDDKDALTVIVPIGEMAGSYGGFEKKVEEVRKKVIAKLEKKLGITDFASKIVTDIKPETPDSWKNKFNCWEGSILGISHSLNNLLYFRPHQKCKQLSNLYFVGASTQPGAGVPLVMCSALSLAPKIEKDLA